MYLYEKLSIAIVDDELSKDTPSGHAMHELIRKMNDIEVNVTEWKTFESALSGIIRLPELDAVIVDWDPVVAENRNLAQNRNRTQTQRQDQNQLHPQVLAHCQCLNRGQVVM